MNLTTPRRGSPSSDARISARAAATVPASIRSWATSTPPESSTAVANARAQVFSHTTASAELFGSSAAPIRSKSSSLSIPSTSPSTWSNEAATSASTWSISTAATVPSFVLGDEHQVEQRDRPRRDEIGEGRGDLPVELVVGERDDGDLDRSQLLVGHGVAPRSGRQGGSSFQGRTVAERRRVGIPRLSRPGSAPELVVQVVDRVDVLLHHVEHDLAGGRTRSSEPTT